MKALEVRFRKVDMLANPGLAERRTTTDAVFDRLHEDIVSLVLLPGTKLSEVEVASRFGVSRQPVRDAFARLANIDLVLVRPQRATVVRGFSMERIAYARFLRLAVELEAIRRACSVWDAERAAVLQRNLDQQHGALGDDGPEAFQALDREFHALICELGGCDLAVQTIDECKRKIDRLCRLSFGREREATTLFEDHERLASALAAGSVEDATALTRTHLGRLDDTIEEIRGAHADYFE